MQEVLAQTIGALTDPHGVAIYLRMLVGAAAGQTGRHPRERGGQ